MISVIVPALDEAPGLPRCLASLGEAGEVIVVDGGSRDATAEVARSLGARVLAAPRGRARQMNAGAALARGNVLLFLHADSWLPPGALRCVQRLMARPDVAGGRFRLRLDARGARYRAIEAAIALLAVLWGGFTGDRGIFVRRSAFEAIGGYADLPLLEDVDLSLRLRRAGRVVLAPLAVTTSARRWQRWGAVRTTATMCAILAGYRLGVPCERLAAAYRRLEAR